MRRRTFLRDLVGTIVVFFFLVILVFGFMLGEMFLDRFKSH
jgi:hypothetical protein